MSYSCCKNIGLVIVSHNQRVVQPTSNNNGCNYRNRAECLLDNKCLTLCIKQSLQHPVNQMRNISVLQKLYLKTVSETTRDFRHKNYVNSPELSKCMWKFKDKQHLPQSGI